MTHLPEEFKVFYRPKDKRQEKTFEALDWLAAMTSHITGQREQMVRYYFIEDEKVVDKILSHLVLNQKNQRPPPKTKAHEVQID